MNINKMVSIGCVSLMFSFGLKAEPVVFVAESGGKAILKDNKIENKGKWKIDQYELSLSYDYSEKDYPNGCQLSLTRKGKAKTLGMWDSQKKSWGSKMHHCSVILGFYEWCSASTNNDEFLSASVRYTEHDGWIGFFASNTTYDKRKPSTYRANFICK